MTIKKNLTKALGKFLRFNLLPDSYLMTASSTVELDRRLSQLADSDILVSQVQTFIENCGDDVGAKSILDSVLRSELNWSKKFFLLTNTKLVDLSSDWAERLVKSQLDATAESFEENDILLLLVFAINRSGQISENDPDDLLKRLDDWLSDAFRENSSLFRSIHEQIGSKHPGKFSMTNLPKIKILFSRKLPPKPVSSISHKQIQPSNNKRLVLTGYTTGASAEKYAKRHRL